MKKLALSALGAFGLLLLVLVAKTALTPSVQPAVTPVEVTVDAQAVAARLGEAVRFRTVSNPEQREPAEFEAFKAWMVRTYPKVHASLEREPVGEALLYTWTGRDSAQKPLILAAHFDVVPVEPGTEGEWSQPPFSGAVKDGAVWGRGAMDDKNAVVAILEAAESLLAEGFTPDRTIYLAFGHDEETMGDGATAVAAALAERGVQAELILDEGLVITDGVIAGLEPLGALIGVAERGYVNVELTARGEGGHSSTPPPQTSVGILSTAIAKLEASPFPARLDGPTRQMLETFGPEMGGPNRLVMANLWLLDGVVLGILEGKRSTNATIRTTMAPTLLEGSVKANVLAQVAKGVINVRIHPRDSIEGVLERMTWVVDDPRVSLRAMTEDFHDEPSEVSSTTSPGYQRVARALRQSFPGVVVAPGLVVGFTDGRKYSAVADDVYRVGAFTYTPEDTHRIHGTDERILIEDLGRAVMFFRQVITGE